MAKILFSNNAVSNLASPLTPTAVSIPLTAGGGALFPSPSAGQIFKLTLTDAATGKINEIVNVTSRTGDTLTVVRGQEGTSPLAWSAGDFAANFLTAGSLANFVTQSDVPVISINPVLYIDPANGNDANDGSSGTPFRTIVAALAYAASHLFAPGGITFQLANPGQTYDAPNYVPYLTGPVTIIGDTANPANYVLANPNAQTGLILSQTPNLRLAGMTLLNQSTTLGALIITTGSASCDNIVFQAPNGTTANHIQVNAGCSMTIGQNSQFSGNAAGLAYVFGLCSAGTLAGGPVINITIIGNPTYSQNFFNVATFGQIDLLPNLNFNGTVQNCAQWYISPLAVMATGGRTGAFVPGTASKNYKDALAVLG